MSTLTDPNTMTTHTPATVIHRSASAVTVTDSLDVPQLTHPQIPFYLKNEVVPRAMINFETWIQTTQSHRETLHTPYGGEKLAVRDQQDEEYFKSKTRSSDGYPNCLLRHLRVNTFQALPTARISTTNDDDDDDDHDHDNNAILPHTIISSHSLRRQPAADILRAVAPTYLLYLLHADSSGYPAGYSFLLQLSYLLIPLARYLDLFTHWVSLYNTSLKVYYLLVAAAVVGYTIRLRARENGVRAIKWREEDWMVFAGVVVAAAVGAWYWNYAAILWLPMASFVMEFFWAFSIYLEPLSAILQYRAIPSAAKTHIPRSLPIYTTLVFLGRALYVPHFIYMSLNDTIAYSAAVAFTFVMGAVCAKTWWVWWNQKEVGYVEVESEKPGSEKLESEVVQIVKDSSLLFV
ncbi:endoplasmic reticulum retention protein [Borealophlyctis nickersoniae]|nr:endoplasmic reticulum retention protein [Borealophlyctis nickersoniae]